MGNVSQVPIENEIDDQKRTKNGIECLIHTNWEIKPNT